MHAQPLIHPLQFATAWAHAHHHPADAEQRHDHPSRFAYLEDAEMAREMEHL